LSDGNFIIFFATFQPMFSIVYPFSTALPIHAFKTLRYQNPFLTLIINPVCLSYRTKANVHELLI